MRASMAKTGYLFLNEGRNHVAPAGHPECPERLDAIEEAVDPEELGLATFQAAPAAREDVLRVHTEQHLALMERIPKEGLKHPDPDMFFSKESWNVALLAAGAAIAACKGVAEGAFDNAFCVVRPPGHHAERERAMGFCILNSVAAAARWLQHHAGVERVAILDWDVHHGNGTQDIFFDDPTVYYASLHQHPLYPGTGFPQERGAENTNLNIQIPPGAEPKAWLKGVKDRILPEFEKFNPEFLIISCGFDAHRLDPISHQFLDADSFVEMTEMVKEIAGGKIVSVLEGGYSLEALGECALKHVKTLQA